MQISKPTRRQFIFTCSALAATATLAPTAFGAPFRGREASSEQISLTAFQRQLSTTFAVHPEGGAPVSVRLVEVRPLVASKDASPDAEDGQNEKFSLLFSGPLESPLEQNTYWFEHPRIGSFAMFIVPIGCVDESRCYYEAIFNRPVAGPRARNSKVGLK